MRHEPAFDGIRAFSALAVILFHLWRNIAPGGWVGVEVFFVLSGFLITRILLREYSQDRRIDLARFYLFRTIRLLPALLLLLAAVGLLALASPSNREVHLRSMVWALFYVSNWSRVFDWGASGLLAHTWSLSLEEQFYLAWPLAFLALVRGNAARWLLVAVAGLTVWRVFLVATEGASVRTYYSFDTRCASLLVGCLLGFGIAGKIEHTAAKLWPVPVGLLLAMVFARSTGTVDHSAGFLLCSVAAGWLIIAAQHESALRRFLSLPLFVRIGKISYGWYLWHYPLIILLQWRVPDEHSGASFWGRICIPFVSCGIAMLSWRFVERPALSLRRFYRSRSAAAAADTTLASRP